MASSSAPDPPPRPPRVFISYSHDSPEHMDRVLALADRLREEGVDARLDQYETSPPEGLPRWCERQIEEADFVLVVCTETYHQRFRGREEKGKGLGVRWEGAILTQQLHDSEARNTRFLPVVLDPTSIEHIPMPLRSATHYDLGSEVGYEDLYRRLTNQPAVKPELRKLRALPPRERQADFQALQRAYRRRARRLRKSGRRMQKPVPTTTGGDELTSLDTTSPPDPGSPPDPSVLDKLPKPEPVHVTTSTPEAVRPGDRFKVHIVFHLEGYEVEEGEGRIVEPDAAVLALRAGAHLAVRLTPLDEDAFAIDEPEATCTWAPPAQRLDFRLRAHRELDDGVYDLRVEYWCEGVQLARSYLEVAVAADAPPQQRSRPAIRRKLPCSAFASYSRRDRVRVADRVEALLGVGIDVFLDCLDIKPAEKWEDVLEKELLTREALLLFWSRNARDSEWVDREWHFALERHGDDHILPNALEPPAVCAPPPELAHLQFGSVLTELREKWVSEQSA